MKMTTVSAKGRETENKVIAYLRSFGLKVERRRLAGIKDQGDVAGWNTDKGSVCVSVKSAATWSPIRWLSDLDDQADAAAAETGFVIARPKGRPDPDDYVVLIRLPWFMELLREAGWLPPDPINRTLDQLRLDSVTVRGDPAFRGAPSDGRPSEWKTP